MPRDRFEQFLTAQPTTDTCPDLERLAAYTLGELDANEQLVIAAHVRGCVVCQLDLSLVQPLVAPLARPRPRTLIARLLPHAPAMAVRGGGAEPERLQYVAEDLHLSLTISRQSQSLWQLTGRVIRDGNGQVGWRVTVSTPGRRQRQETDAAGLFLVEGLPAGRCQLSLSDGQQRVRVTDLYLGPFAE